MRLEKSDGHSMMSRTFWDESNINIIYLEAGLKMLSQGRKIFEFGNENPVREKLCPRR